MADQLVPFGGFLDPVRNEIEGAHDTLKATRSPATRKAYASDWNLFCIFCEERL